LIGNKNQKATKNTRMHKEKYTLSTFVFFESWWLNKKNKKTLHKNFAVNNLPLSLQSENEKGV